MGRRHRVRCHDREQGSAVLLALHHDTGGDPHGSGTDAVERAEQCVLVRCQGRRALRSYGGMRFFNPGGIAPQPFTAVPRMLLERRTPWPSHVDTPPQHPPPPHSADALITFIGHATGLMQTAAGDIPTDPM